MILRTLIVAISLLSAGLAIGQENEFYITEIQNYRRGLELFDKEKFGAAQKVFSQVIDDVNDPRNETSVNAEYYAAICGVYLFNRDADFLLREFIENHPESPQVKKAYYQLGSFHHRKRKWGKAIYWFNKVNPHNLSSSENYEYHFKLGYSHFQQKSNKEAAEHFFQVKDVENTYAAPAQYYFSHITYDQSKNQTALEGFKKLESHPQFGAVVPYYITQILYKQEKFDEVIKYAPSLLANTNTKRVDEISRLIGESYYGKKQYAEAIPYLEKYINQSKSDAPEDRYELAFCYYKNKEYDKAISIFGRLGAYENELGQTSLYQLAECYLKLKKKNEARNAFLEVYKMAYDVKLTEDGLFNYAKLSLELKFDPYNNVTKAFKKYIDEYPNSDKIDDAYNYLTQVYLTTKNYDEALSSIEQIKDLDVRLKEAYQKIAFNKGLEQFQNRKYEESTQYLQRSRKYPINKAFNTLTYYWIAEANYRLENYLDAIEGFKSYIYEPLAILQPEFEMAHYSLGYAYMKIEDYSNASTWLRKYSDNVNVIDTIRKSDANIRVADCFFIQKEYYQAVDFYGEASLLNSIDADYALFQKAVAHGILKDSERKESTLLGLIEKYPSSNYIDGAKYQLGRGYMLASNNQKALIFLGSVVDEHPNSVYVKRALVSLGLIHYNSNNNAEALKVFKRIVNDYPNYEDSKEALVGIENIYIEKGQIDEYALYIDGIDFVNLTQASLDSTTFQAAELKYMDGDCESAIEFLSKYLNKFTPANFEIKANYYRADCYYKKGDYDLALADYLTVSSRGNSAYAEASLLKASQMIYKKEDYSQALSLYVDLEKIASTTDNFHVSVTGQMRCFYYLNSIESASEYADRALINEKVNEDEWVEAYFIKAVASEQKGEFEKALTFYQLVSDTTEAEFSAESKYHMAEIYYKMDSFDLVTAQINEIVTQVPTYDYWIAKGLILLSDVFLANGDIFQAKATLQSIVDNYTGDQMLIQIAETNLQKLIEMEIPEEEVEEEPMQIDFGDLNEEMELLFEDEEEVDEELPSNKND